MHEQSYCTKLIASLCKQSIRDNTVLNDRMIGQVKVFNYNLACDVSYNYTYHLQNKVSIYVWNP